MRNYSPMLDIGDDHMMEFDITTAKFEGLEITGNSELVNSITGVFSSPDVVLKSKEPLTIAVSLSRPIVDDLEREGYNVVLKIGSPREITVEEMTRLAETVAVIIDKTRRLVECKTLILVLSCPVAVAFLIGTILGHHVTYKLLHWDNGYIEIPAYSIQRYKKYLQSKLKA